MSAFCEDETIWEKFFYSDIGSDSEDILPLTVLEWYHNTDWAPQELSLTSADALIDRDYNSDCTLRVIISPSSASYPGEENGLRLLFRHYSIPSAAVSERIHSVAHSFGYSSTHIAPGVELAWCHFLCKDIPTPSEDEETDPMHRGHYPENWNWKVYDFVIHTRRDQSRRECITLLCFGSPQRLVHRLRRLLRNPSWRDAVDEPFLLFSIVYEELYNTVDKLAWRLADHFRPVEMATLKHARNHSRTAVDFTSLHDMSKHCIYMNEAVEAAILTLNAMTSHLKAAGTSPRGAAISSLIYRTSIFQSTHLRLRSLEKRMANVISLSFNLVTQQDSRVMQNDSSAMKAIAVMTLIFLPATGISSIFSMPFFIVDIAGPGTKMLRVAACFWIFWVVALPLTAMIFLVWYWIYRHTKENRVGTMSGHWKLRWPGREPSSQEKQV